MYFCVLKHSKLFGAVPFKLFVLKDCFFFFPFIYYEPMLLKYSKMNSFTKKEVNTNRMRATSRIFFFK